jgi:phosphoribosyl-AMP cyclohydrolase
MSENDKINKEIKDLEKKKKQELEEGGIFQLDFTKLRKVCEKVILKDDIDVIPVVVQDADTREVLVLAYTNKLAFEHTLKTKLVTLWSTSRNKFWIKGEESGNYLNFVEAWINCEQNSLLYLARTATGVCHTKDELGKPRLSCYYRKIVAVENGQFLEKHPGVWDR